MSRSDKAGKSRPDVDAFYNGRERDHLVGIGAYWGPALLYAAPALLAAAVSPFRDEPRGAVARGAKYALLGFAFIYTLGVVSFAFDPPSRSPERPTHRRAQPPPAESRGTRPTRAARWCRWGHVRAPTTQMS